MRAQLKGAIVMTQPILTNFVRKDRPQPSDPELRADVGRLRDVGAAAAAAGAAPAGETPQQRGAARRRRAEDAGAGVILKPSVGEHGTVFVTGRDGGPGAVPSVTLSAEHYNMIARHAAAATFR